MGRQTTFSSMVTYLLLMYSIMGWISTALIAATTLGYSHYPAASCVSIISAIHLAAW